MAASGNMSADIVLPIRFGTKVRGAIHLAGPIEPAAREHLPWIALSLTAHLVRVEELRGHGEHLRGFMHDLRGSLGRLAALAQYRGAEMDARVEEARDAAVETCERLFDDLSAYAQWTGNEGNPEPCDIGTAIERAVYEARTFWPGLATGIRVEVPAVAISISELAFVGVLVRAFRCVSKAVPDANAGPGARIVGTRIPGGMELRLTYPLSADAVTSKPLSLCTDALLCRRLLEMQGGGFDIVDVANAIMATITVPSPNSEGF